MRPVVRALLLGAVLGLGTSGVNHLPGTPGQILGQIVGLGWSWAAVAVLAGVLARPRGRVRAGAVAGTLCLLVAVVCYYPMDAVFADLSGARGMWDPSSMLAEVTFWSIGALITGPPLGAAGALWHRDGLVGLAARLVVPLAAIGDNAMRIAGGGAPSGTDGDRIADLTGRWVLAAAVACAVVLLARHAIVSRRPATP